MILGSSTVKPLEENMRIDVYLADKEELSRSQWQKEIREGNVYVDGQRIKPNFILKEGQKIKWKIPNKDLIIKPVNLNIDVLYEDDYLAVINKPRGLSVHPGNGPKEITLVNGLLYRFESLSDISGENRPGIVHRLDKETSGLLIIAKENNVHKKLATQFKARTVYREYEAVVKGILDREVVINKPIARHQRKRVLMDVVSGGKESISIVKPKLILKNSTLVSVEIKTGRTHQIRVHLKSIGHPIIGDLKYGGKEKNVDELLLSSIKIAFIHPITNEKISFNLDRPTEIKDYVKKNQG